MQENKIEETATARLLDVPGIAEQRGWKAWKATFADLSVSYDRAHHAQGFSYVAIGTNKKESDTPTRYQSPPDIEYLCKQLVALYGLNDAADSSEWTVKKLVSPL